MPSGKSISQIRTRGIRRTDKEGNKLSPRSLRKKIRFLKDCSKKSLIDLGLIQEKED